MLRENSTNRDPHHATSVNLFTMAAAVFVPKVSASMAEWSATKETEIMNTQGTNEIRVLDDAELEMVNGGLLKEAIDAVIDFIDAVHFEIMFLNILVGPDGP